MRAIRRNTAPGKDDKSEDMPLANANDIRFLADYGVNFTTADRCILGIDLCAWDPREGTSGVDDPPEQLDPSIAGNEVPLGGHPGGLIQPVAPENAADAEEDVGEDPVEGESSRRNHRADRHRPQKEGGDDGFDEGPEEAPSAPVEKSMASKRKGDADPGQKPFAKRHKQEPSAALTRPKRGKKRPAAEEDEDEANVGAAPPMKATSKSTAKKTTAAKRKAGAASETKAAAAPEAKAKPQRKPSYIAS